MAATADRSSLQPPLLQYPAKHLVGSEHDGFRGGCRPDFYMSIVFRKPLARVRKSGISSHKCERVFHAIAGERVSASGTGAAEYCAGPKPSTG